VSDTQFAFESWVFEQLDQRSWFACSRSAEVDLQNFEIVITVGGDAHSSAVHIEPEGRTSDPGLMCVALQLVHPPQFPVPEAPTELRLPLSRVAIEATGD
jgi:hypothetical protein